jgi:sugar phosphate isomerase/epimerase
MKYIRKLDVSGVEITFASKEALYSFKLSKNDKSWLKSLDYISIHAPFNLVKESKNKEEVIKQLSAILKLYEDVNAKNVVIHPDDLPNLKILEKYKFNISTENLPPGRHITLSYLRKILNTYPNIRFCLDVSHAYTHSKYETNKLINAFKHKISQIHFSGTYRRRYHQSLRSVTGDFLSSIQHVKELSVPIIIEESIETKSLKFVKEEIAYIKNLLD